MDFRDNQKMYDYFYLRTNKHIEKVKEYYYKLCDFSGYEADPEQARKHDETKYKEPELIPYVWLNWKYFCQDNGVALPEEFATDNIVNKIKQATFHHISNNPHHPEYWDKGFTRENFNEKNRDGIPPVPVDAKEMPVMYLIEMVADWFSVSYERGEDPHHWAQKNVNKRWLFSPDQTDFIYTLLDAWDVGE